MRWKNERPGLKSQLGLGTGIGRNVMRLLQTRATPTLSFGGGVSRVT